MVEFQLSTEDLQENLHPRLGSLAIPVEFVPSGFAALHNPSSIFKISTPAYCLSTTSTGLPPSFSPYHLQGVIKDLQKATENQHDELLLMNVNVGKIYHILKDLPCGNSHKRKRENTLPDNDNGMRESDDIDNNNPSNADHAIRNFMDFACKEAPISYLSSVFPYNEKKGSKITKQANEDDTMDIEETSVEETKEANQSQKQTKNSKKKSNKLCIDRTDYENLPFSRDAEENSTIIVNGGNLPVNQIQLNDMMINLIKASVICLFSPINAKSVSKTRLGNACRAIRSSAILATNHYNDPKATNRKNGLILSTISLPNKDSVNVVKRLCSDLNPLSIDGIALTGHLLEEEPLSNYTDELPVVLNCFKKEILRIVFIEGHPIKVLKMVALGIDVITSNYPFDLAKQALALNIATYKQFESSVREKESISARECFVDISDQNFKDKTFPVAKDCQCYCCTNHSIGYLNHLFVTKELLFDILLSRYKTFNTSSRKQQPEYLGSYVHFCNRHNVYQYLLYFYSIRESIKKNQFVQYSQYITHLFNKP